MSKATFHIKIDNIPYRIAWTSDNGRFRLIEYTMLGEKGWLFESNIGMSGKWRKMENTPTGDMAYLAEAVGKGLGTS